MFFRGIRDVYTLSNFRRAIREDELRRILEVDYGEDYICFYCVIPVYVVKVFGEPLMIDPEVRISLPKDYRVVDVTNDVLTFEVTYEVKGYHSEIVVTGSRDFRGSSLNDYLFVTLAVFVLGTLLFKLLRRNCKFRVM